MCVITSITDSSVELIDKTSSGGGGGFGFVSSGGGNGGVVTISIMELLLLWDSTSITSSLNFLVGVSPDSEADRFLLPLDFG